MKEKLTSREIAIRHRVTQRTAFRWLASNDPRCYGEPIVESEIPRASKEEKLRKILDNLPDANIDLAIFSWGLDNKSPEFKRIDKLRGAIWRAIDRLQRESGVYPATYWEEE